MPRATPAEEAPKRGECVGTEGAREKRGKYGNGEIPLRGGKSLKYDAEVAESGLTRASLLD